MEHETPLAPGRGVASARNDLVKAIHCALLQLCGPDVTRGFWSKHPLDLGNGPLSLAQLLEHIWDGERTSPVVWHSQVQYNLERLLCEQRVPVGPFMDRVRMHAGGKAWLRASDVLSWLTPLLPALFRLADPYQMLLHSVSLTTRKFAPETTFEQVGRTCRGRDSCSAIMILTYPDLISGDALPIDNSVFTASSIVVSAELFGIPPFSALEDLSDARSAESIAGDRDCSTSDGVFYIDGLRHGHVESLYAFCSFHGLDVRRYGIPDSPVVVVEVAYRCPRCHRVVLKEGCAYGAPIHLFRFSWPRDVRPTEKKLLETLIEETVADTDALLNGSIQLHRELASQVERIVHVHYTREDVAIAIDGIHLCKGTAARILRYCVGTAFERGQMEFSFRELKRDPSLISHPKNTGLEVRLARLRQALELHHTGLSIEATRRGSFRLLCDGRLKFTES